MRRLASRSAWLAGLCLLIVLLAPQTRAAENEDVAAAIREFITSGHATLASETDDERLFQIFTFYEDRDFKPIWTRDAGAKTKARVLLEALRSAADHGLDPAYYSIPEIEARIDSTNPEELAELDLVLSDVFADFGRDLSRGRIIPTQLARDIQLVPHGPGPLHLIDGAEAADDLGPYLDSLAPQTPQYARLKEKLAEYRAIAEKGGWPAIEAGATLKPGMADPRLPALARLLTTTGDLPGQAGDPPAVYDERLVGAIKSFQSRHGLADDGVIGPATLAAFNVPVEDRIRQMEINLERRRWMEDRLGELYLFVNLADAYLKVVQETGDREKTIHTARLVVGKPYTRTPVFSEMVSYVVINPNWGVPASIANNEFLPKLKADPGFLLRQNIRIFSGSSEVDPFSVNWQSLSRVPYQLRQDPGDGNALGRIKFMFPNPFNVYLHDTPSKSLFEKEVRYFSHGCMRVQNPEQLAELLLGRQGWTRDKIRAQIASGKQRIVNLERKIPIHITYLTAWVNKDGSVHFRNDVYGRDKQLAAALFGGS